MLIFKIDWNNRLNTWVMQSSVNENDISIMWESIWRLIASVCLSSKEEANISDELTKELFESILYQLKQVWTWVLKAKWIE